MGQQEHNRDMHMAVFEAYRRDQPFTAEQVAWLKGHAMTPLMRAYYLRHYYTWLAKKEDTNGTVNTRKGNTERLNT